MHQATENNTTTRRAFVAAAAAATVAAPMPALAAGDHPDAKLLALAREYEETRAKDRAARDRHKAGHNEAAKYLPELNLPVIEPLDVLLFGGRIMRRCVLEDINTFVAGAPFLRWHVAAIRHRPFTVLDQKGIDRLPVPEAQRRADELSKMMSDHIKACDAVYERYGLLEIDGEIERLENRLDDLIAALTTTKATTLEGVAAKARAFHDFDNYEWEHDEVITDRLRALLADLGVVVAVSSEDKDRAVA
ncbi:MAG: hypothetical protein AB7O60_15250 [Variibacter sp.]